MQLRRGDVLNGAMAILNEYGLADLTMRRLATSLGVQPGALYWHFPNKQTLLGAMADTILADMSAPSATTAASTNAWDEELSLLAHRMRSVLLAHRDGAELVSATYASRLASSAPRDAFARAALRAGLPAPHAELASYTLLYYILGHTVDEQSRSQMESVGALTRARLADTSERDASDDIDLLDGDPLVRFDFGLALFIDGIRTQTTGQSQQSRGAATESMTAPPG